jgi:hypothetical protein
LNNSLRLDDFGDGIKKVFFAFIAVSPDNINHDEEISFKNANKRLLIRKKLPHDSFKNTSEIELKKLMVRTFFFSLQHVAFLNIENFRIKDFLQAAEDLFLKNGWLEKIEIA